MISYDLDKMLYTIPADKHSTEEIREILGKHPEIKFVSLVGIDVGGHDTDEKIPVEEFLKDMAEAGHYVATCYTAEDAIQVLTEYCSLPKATELKLSPIAEPVKLPVYQEMKEANNSIWKEGTVTQPKWR